MAPSRAVACPIAPKPTRPSVRPASSISRAVNLKLSSPARTERSASGRALARAKISASVCSATETALAPGVFTTTIPAPVASAVATWSVPVPCTPITRRAGAAAMARAGKPVLRVMTATQSATSRASVSGSVPLAGRGSRPAARNRSRPAAWIGWTMRHGPVITGEDLCTRGGVTSTFRAGPV